MPEVSSAEKNGHVRHIVKLQPGEQVMLCRCYQSSKFPFCDVSHAKCENSVGPVIVQVAEASAESSELK